MTSSARPLSLRSLLLGSTAFWSIFSILAAAEFYAPVASHGHSFLRFLAASVIGWSLWIPLTPLIARLGERFPVIPFAWPNTLLHLAVAVVVSLAHVAWFVGSFVYFRPYGEMDARPFREAFLGSLTRMHSDVILYAATLGVCLAFSYQRRFREREVAAARLESSLMQSQLHVLSLQLQPHFLFNTLHAIGGLVRQSRNGEAVSMISNLSDLLRITLSKSAAEVTLRDELELLRRYVAIQEVRFSDRLTTEFDVEETLLDLAVPALILQPLVENAIRHGISANAEAGEVVVSAKIVDGRLRLAVFNTGPRLGAVIPGVGLTNTRERLARLYGADSLQIRDVQGGVEVSFFTPARRFGVEAA